MNRFKSEIVRHGAGGIEVPGHEGTWYVIGKVELSDFVLLLVESEQHGEDAAPLIITKNPDGGIFLVLEDCFDGFDSLLDWYESKEELEAVLSVLMSVEAEARGCGDMRLCAGCFNRDDCEKEVKS